MLDELEELDDLTARAGDALSRDEGMTPAVMRLLLRRYTMTGRGDLEALLAPGLALALERGALEADQIRQAAWLELFVEAAGLSQDHRVRDAASALATRIRAQSAPSQHGTVSTAMRAIHACLRAADLFAETEVGSTLVVHSVEALESLIGPLYRPGSGMPHCVGGLQRSAGTLGDQVNTASALLAAHAWTGRLPYSMLAEELVQLARRSCWPAEAEDRAEPVRFVDSCAAVTVLCDLATIHADPDYQQAAVVAADGDYARDAASLLRLLFEASRRHPIEVAAQFGLALCDWLNLEQ